MQGSRAASPHIPASAAPLSPPPDDAADRRLAALAAFVLVREE
ncbi:MAG: hypothetical protein ACYDEB_01485 [Dehalococcoidia bacterium]